MTTLMETLRYNSGMVGEEAADLIEKLESEISDHDAAYELLFKENAKLRDALQSFLAAEIECEIFESHVAPALAKFKTYNAGNNAPPKAVAVD